MDKQAFKQRMQQLKQYREQNPGKTYLDFKQYADGGEVKKDSINTPRQDMQDVPTTPLKLTNWSTPNPYKNPTAPIKGKPFKGFGFTSILDFIDLGADEYEIQKSPNPQQTRRYRDYQTRSAIGLEDQGLEALYSSTPHMEEGGEIEDRTDHPVYKPIIPQVIEGKDTVTGERFSDLTEDRKDAWRSKYGMNHYGKKIARGNLTEVYPEFDIISGVRGLVNTVKNVGTSAYKDLSVSSAFDKALNKSDKLDILSKYPELGQVGTPFQYSKYVDEIFPESQFKGVFYHGGKKGIDRFHAPKDKDFVLNKGVNSGTKDHGIYFTKDKSLADYYSKSYPKNDRATYKVKLNAQEPYETNDFIGLRARQFFNKDYVNPQSITDRVRYGKLKNNDSVLWGGEKGEAVVFDPDQIHILGNKDDLKGFSNYTGNSFEEGGGIPPTNKPKVPQDPQQYKGTLYKDRYGKKYTEDQVDDYYSNSTDEIDRFTGKPLVRGLKPALDIEDAANATPIGDVIAAYDAYSSARQGDWLGAGLSTLAMLPFVPMSVKEYSRKYKGITPKVRNKNRLNSNNIVTPKIKIKNDVKPFNTTVNKDKTQQLIDQVTNKYTINNAMQAKASNQGYKIAERLMDDPEYLDRALQVKKKFGDDYTQVYADIIDAYNNNPNSYLPVVDVYNNPRSTVNGSMRNLGHGNYNYTINADMADLSANLTEHEWSHYADFKRNLDRPDAHGDSNMFYQMSKDLDNKKIDGRDSYYQMPTEQKAHMNQLREYMFQNGYIGKRGDAIESKMMKNVLDDIRNVPSMKGVFRASQQFKNINKYTKWFNSIPLLGVGAAAMYNNQEKSN